MTQGAVAVGVARARAFVQMHGDPLQQARAVAATDPQGSQLVLDLLPPVETPVGAYVVLGWLDALRVRRGDAVDRAARLLAAVQLDDGSWILGDERDVADEIATTTSISGLLAKVPSVRKSVLDRAGDWLGARWSPDRVQGGDARAIGGWAAFFANVDHALSDAGLQWCGRELERGFRAGSIDALGVARVLLRCDAHALPGARVSADEVVLSLVAQQALDGSFHGPEVDRAVRVEATLEALHALHRLGGPPLGYAAR